MKLIYYIISLFIFTSCQIESDDKAIVLNKTDETNIVASKIGIEDELYISMFSFLQSNNKGLYITPPRSIDGYVLYKYPFTKLGECCVRLEGVISEGSGPNELLQINLSTKTSLGDTLIFYSINDASYLIIDEEGKINENEIEASNNLVNTGNSFAYSNGHLLLPTFFQTFNSDYLLNIINLRKSKNFNFFPPRIPPGFEPSIRNQIFPMGALPDGFAFSFLGDRKIYIVDFEGVIKYELILGESDPIPKPFKVLNPNDIPGSRPHITKIEYFQDNLFVLLDNVIWVIDYSMLEVKHMIRVLRTTTEKSAPVIDFSITDEVVYLRIGHDGLFYIETDRSWFKN